MDGYERVHAIIDLDCICDNVINIQKKVQSNHIICVIKADGYGHGSIPIALELEEMDMVEGYAVATVQEGILLRKAGIKKSILVLGYVFPSTYENMIMNKITPTLFDLYSARQLQDCAQKMKVTVPVHIKVDTGMARIGISPNRQGVEFVKEVMSYKNIFVEGIFTHFSQADMYDQRFTEKQLCTFKDFVTTIEVETQTIIPKKHYANSAGIIQLEEDLDMVRAGIILYGLWPSDQVSQERILLNPALSLHSQVIYVKEVGPGTEIGYGGTYIAKDEMKVATIPVGYGDGYPRGLSNKGHVLIHGKPAKILGRICMDQFMVDVTEINNVQIGDSVTLIGRDENKIITIEDLGELSGRFNYELACDLGKRIPRIYIRNQKQKYKKDYFDDFVIETI